MSTPTPASNDLQHPTGSVQPDCSVARTPAVIQALCAEHAALENLMAIVEGCLGERWASKGRRLVDTPEWCKLYTARCRVNDADARAKMMTPPNAKLRDAGESGVEQH